MARADPYADIDFDEVTEATGLAADEIKCLKVPFWDYAFFENTFFKVAFL